MSDLYGPENFLADTNVSRETLARLTAFADLLLHWQKRMNLVGPGSIEDLWRRHFLDSAQLLPLLPDPRDGRLAIVDLGSGGGFPGLVLAILDAGDVHLVESDTRKAVFLREAARISATEVHVHNCRIADLEPIPADCITARALAPLTQLLEHALPLVTNYSVCLFHKGQDVEEELTEATKYWKMDVTRHQSVTDPEATILEIRKATRVR